MREDAHRDSLVIPMDINGSIVQRILVDMGSNINVMYYNVFLKLGLSYGQLRPIRTSTAGFTSNTIEMKGSITLVVKLGTR